MIICFCRLKLPGISRGTPALTKSWKGRMEMSRPEITALAEKMQQGVEKQRQKEQSALQIIVAITSPEFAKQAADTLDSKKHPYSFETYLVLLGRLQELISAGMPNCLALDAVQTCETSETIINVWRLAR